MPATKPLSVKTARKMTNDALWNRHNTISDKPKASRTYAEELTLEVVGAELNRRATAMFAPYFKGIF